MQIWPHKGFFENKKVSNRDGAILETFESQIRKVVRKFQEKTINAFQFLLLI